MLSVAWQSYSKLTNWCHYFLFLFGLGLVKNTVGRLSHLSSINLYMDRHTWLTCYLHGMMTVMVNSSLGVSKKKPLDVLPTSHLSPTCSGTDLPRTRNSIKNSVKNDYSFVLMKQRFLKKHTPLKVICFFFFSELKQKEGCQENILLKVSTAATILFSFVVANSRNVSTK